MGGRMRTTFLFDLDGTLLPLDQDSFVREYFRLLVPELVGYLPADRVVETVMESTRYMIADSCGARPTGKPLWRISARECLQTRMNWRRRSTVSTEGSSLSSPACVSRG